MYLRGALRKGQKHKDEQHSGIVIWTTYKLMVYLTMITNLYIIVHIIELWN